MFPTALALERDHGAGVRRNRNGRKVPPQFQRSDAEDLLAVVFPDQVACAENLAGEREIPDHPLVAQVIHDCLHELMDIDGLERLLERIAAGEVEVIARELTSPSPLAQEIIAARPYAFLDDVPAEERRTQAIRSRHLLDAESAAELGRLDPAAIERVCTEAWPEARSADELHDALTLTGFITVAEAGARGGAHWPRLLDELVASGRATRLRAPGVPELWASAERLGQISACLPAAVCEPPLAALEPVDDAAVALREISRSRLETLGPVTAAELAAPLGLSGDEILPALVALEVDGQAMRGRYRDAAPGEARGGEEWCDRRLLARIHRLTLKSLRAAVQPVSQAACMRFLFDWQGLGARGQGPEALRGALSRLLGYPAPAVAWEQQLLPARIEHYSRHDLDTLLAGGEFQWLRAPVEPAGEQRRSGPVRSTPVMFIDRDRADAWQALLPAGTDQALPLSSAAQRLREALARHGAMFFVDLVRQTGLLRTQVETALGELVAWGLASSDGFAGLRALVTPAAQRARFSRPVGRRGISIDGAGRWSLVTPLPALPEVPPSAAEHAARVLLDRYGIVFRALLAREARWLPPWRELVRVLRRLEARGELRGGRFVEGFSGEQFALPEAVEALRSAARRADSGDEIIVCAADPLNLTGIITPGERIPALAGNRVLYRNGTPVAAQAGGVFRWLAPAGGPEAEWNARNALLRADPRATLASAPSRLL
jgi:ATP-dependent helicase Lhr and Lhr-like helicase